ncbi:MAG: glutamate-1-semialdehyde 2,1-aminomutase [Pseudomonadota bacterium]|nr:glutamate-1-semialdehyde 2,1-aminomutase [Pseudomonadota bacterium]
MDRHEALFARAQRVIPGGVSSPVRAFKSVGGHPRYIVRGEGATLVGAEGERWTDFCLAWGPLILGHAHPAVVEAVSRAARDGMAFGTVNQGEIELAERILAAFPGRERVRLVCSGTEAVLTALRIARGATGRTKVLKFGGCYHGHGDGMLVKAGSGLVTLGVGDSAGISPAVAADTVVVPLDDEQALDDAFATWGSDIAAAIVEPLPANNGLLTQRPEWLRHLRAQCTKYGALLILDEVITGFRFGYHGYERVVDVKADLTTLGKIVGGGLPVAAVVGRAAEMDLLAPAGPVYQAGTMAGNPVCVAAGIATLDVLAKGDVYAHLDALGRHFDALPKKMSWVRQGPILWPWLGDGAPPRTDTAIPSSVRAPFGKMHAAWLEAGVYFPPSAFEVGFLCSAHTTADLDHLVEVGERAFGA